MKYNLTNDHKMVLEVENWPVLTILAHNAAKTLNGHRRFITTFKDLASQLGHSVTIRQVQRNLGRVPAEVENAEVNVKEQFLCSFVYKSASEHAALQVYCMTDANATEEQKWSFFGYVFFDFHKIRWVDKAFLDKWGTELSCPKRFLFTALIRPFEMLKNSGHTEKDSVIAKCSDILELNRIFGFKNILDGNTVVELPEALLIQSPIFQNFTKTCLLFGIETSNTPKIWNRRQLVPAIVSIYRKCGVKFLTETHGKTRGNQSNIVLMKIGTIKKIRQYKYRLCPQSILEMMRMVKMTFALFDENGALEDSTTSEKRHILKMREDCREQFENLDLGEYAKYQQEREVVMEEMP